MGGNGGNRGIVLYLRIFSILGIYKVYVLYGGRLKPFPFITPFPLNKKAAVLTLDRECVYTTTMPKNDISYIALGSIVSLPGNPKLHTKAGIKTSISRLGFLEPLVVNRVTTHLISGHGRVEALLALRAAGNGPPTGVVIQDGDWHVPAFFVEVPTDLEAPAALALNRLVELGGWDKQLVRDMLVSLSPEMLELTGFDAGWMPPVDGNTDPDTLPTEADPRTKPGDVWECGDHLVLCGDSTDPVAVGALWERVKYKSAMMVTDPPYGVEYDPAWRAQVGINKSNKKMGIITGDKNADWSAAWLLFPGDVGYVWHAGIYSHIVYASLVSVGMEVRSQIIWVKDRFALSRGHYHWHHEPCWYVVRDGCNAGWAGARDQSTKWDIPAREDGGHGHGTQKPVECMERPIRNHTCDVVYDPFLGSGSTLIAAERARRKCVAIEISPTYVDVAVTRWENFTSKKAKLTTSKK